MQHQSEPYLHLPRTSSRDAVRATLLRDAVPYAHPKRRLERGHERPRRESAHPDRPGGAHDAIPDRRTVAVRVAGVTTVLQPQHVEESLAGPPVVQRQRARGLQHDLDPVVHERAALDHRALSGPVGPSRSLRERGAPDSEAGHGRQAQRHAHAVHFVLIRVVPGRVEPLVPRSPVEQLQRDRSTVRPREPERPVSLALARHLPGGRPYQDVAPKQRDIDHHHAAAGPRRGIPQHERRRRVAGAFPGGVGVVPYQIEHGAAHDVTRQRLDAREPPGHGAGDIVARAPGDGIVELAADERAPRQLEQGTPVATSRAPRKRGQRLGEALQAQLSSRSAPLERRAGGVHAL